MENRITGNFDSPGKKMPREAWESMEQIPVKAMAYVYQRAKLRGTIPAPWEGKLAYRRFLMTWQIMISILLLTAIFFLSFFLDAGSMGVVSNLNALMIVLGGTIGATLMSYPMKRLVFTFKVLKKSLGARGEGEGLIPVIVRLARNYRGGWDIRHLEQQVKELPPGLLRTGVEMIAYQYDRGKIDQVMRQEASGIRDQYESAGEILQHLSQIVPSMGLIGTLVNFIRFLGLSNDIHGLAGYAALAFLSTFYGVLLSRVGLVPLGIKIKELIREETFRMDLIREGILDILDQEHPRSIQFKLESRLAARETLNPIPKSPEVVLLPSEEIGLESKGVGSILIN
jgi:chemotaxis protein MotA